MLKNTYEGQACSIARSLELIGERWTLLIVRDIFRGQRRFDDIQESLGIARNVLANRLDRLVEEGIIEKRRYQERPPRYEYFLTEKGIDLWPVLVSLIKWGDKHEPSAIRRAAAGRHPPQGVRRRDRRPLHLRRNAASASGRATATSSAGCRSEPPRRYAAGAWLSTRLSKARPTTPSPSRWTPTGSASTRMRSTRTTPSTTTPTRREAAGFRDVVAPPMFAVVYSAPAMGPPIFEVIGEALPRMVHGGQEFVWGEPVCAGDTISTEASVKEIYEKDGKGFYVFESVSKNQDGDQVVRATWTNIVRGV